MLQTDVEQTHVYEEADPSREERASGRPRRRPASRSPCRRCRKPPKRLPCGTRVGGRRPPNPCNRRAPPGITPRGLGRTRQRAREERSTPLTSSPIALRTTTAPRHVPRQQAGKAIAHPAPTAGLTPAKQRAGGLAVLLADVLGVPVFPTPAASTVSRADPAKPALYRSLQKQALNRKRRRRIVQDVPFGMALEGRGPDRRRHPRTTRRPDPPHVGRARRRSRPARRVPRTSTEASPGRPSQRRPRSPRSARPSQEGD